MLMAIKMIFFRVRLMRNHLEEVDLSILQDKTLKVKNPKLERHTE